MVVIGTHGNGIYSRSVIPTGISPFDNTIPINFSLEQNYPNPFNPTTTISYNLPKAATVIVKVHNLLGREVRTLVNERMTAGQKWVVWDGKDRFGQEVSSGTYIYKIQAGDYLQSRRMVLIR